MISKTEQSWIDTVFLALVVWREARGESNECKSAVAFSILNRVKRPSWWGKTVQEVLFKKWQYTSMTAPHDPQLTKWPIDSDKSWEQCFRAAVDAISDNVLNPVVGADSYWDDSISRPKWANDQNFVKKINRINFHNVDGDYEKVS